MSIRQMDVKKCTNTEEQPRGTKRDDQKKRQNSTYDTTDVQTKQKVREKSRECQNHKPQPFPDTKRKRKQTKPNKRKSNKRTKSTKISALFPSEVITMLKGLKNTRTK